ncbi:hypothetical protein ThvES_00008000 [Thiovulum sp. ES]|nr:hypothetical protein ThvES_00008000 [Thiovulum sp. ES]
MSVILQLAEKLTKESEIFDRTLYPTEDNHISKGYKKILFRATSPLQSSELNEIQSLFLNEMKKLSDTLYKKSGSLIEGGSVYINKTDKSHYLELKGLEFLHTDSNKYFTFEMNKTEDYQEIRHETSSDEQMIYFYLPMKKGKATSTVKDLHDYILSDKSSLGLKEILPIKLIKDQEETLINIINPLIITNNKVTVSVSGSTTLYYEGFYIDIDGKDSLFTEPVYKEDGTINTYTVGILISAVRVKADTDPTLRDLAPGYAYDSRGADRLQLKGEWVLSKTSQEEPFFGVWQIEGAVVINANRIDPEMRGVLDIVGRYDYNSNGNYVVKGLRPTVNQRLTNSTNPEIIEELHMNISSGNANVGGYNLSFLYDQSFSYQLFTSEDTSTLISDRQSEDYFIGNFLAYKFTDKFIHSIESVVGHKRLIDTVITRSNTGDLDYIYISDITESVFQISYITPQISVGEAIYKMNSDWTLSHNSGKAYIKWLSGNRPEKGSTFTILKLFYRYEYTNVSERSLVSVEGVDRNKIRLMYSMFQFDSEGAFKYKLSATYRLVSPRKDRLILKREDMFNSVSGRFFILRGKSNLYRTPIAPVTDNINSLSLATISVEYGKTPVIEYEAYRVFMMSEIQDMADRLQKLEKGMSNLFLLSQARAESGASELSDIFIDSFTDDSLLDRELIEALKETCVTVSEDKSISLNSDWETFNLDTGIKGTRITLPVKSNYYTTEIKQELYSALKRINRLSTKKPPFVNLTITPNTLRWVDEHITTTTSVTSLAGRTTEELNSNRMLPTPTKIVISAPAGAYNPDVELDLYIDDIKVSGSYNSNSDGSVSLTVDIGGYNSGTRGIAVMETVEKFLDNLSGEYLGTRGSASFTGIPMKTTLVTYTPPPPPPCNCCHCGDPTSQVFYVSNSFNLHSIEFYIGAENGSETATLLSDLTVYVVELTAGIPDITKMVTKATIPYVADGEKTEVSSLQPTEVEFEDKILLEKDTYYAFILYTNQTELVTRIATLGEKDLFTGNWISVQPYLQGVMLESSNMVTWTPVQNSDLWFKINGIVFENTVTHSFTYKFDTPRKVSNFSLLSAETIEENTSIEKKVKLIDTEGGAFLHDVELYETVSIPSNNIKSIEVSVKLTSNSLETETLLSPQLDNSIQLSVSDITDKSVYISKSISNWSNQNSLKTYLTIHNYRDSNVKVFYSLTNGYTWNELSKVTQQNMQEFLFEISKKRVFTTLTFQTDTNYTDNLCFSVLLFNYNDGITYILNAYKEVLPTTDINSYIRNINISIKGLDLSEVQELLNKTLTDLDFNVNKVDTNSVKISSKIDGHHLYAEDYTGLTIFEDIYHNRVLNNSGEASTFIEIIDSEEVGSDKIDFRKGFSPRIKIELSVTDKDKLNRPKIFNLRAIATETEY